MTKIYKSGKIYVGYLYILIKIENDDYDFSFLQEPVLVPARKEVVYLYETQKDLPQLCGDLVFDDLGLLFVPACKCCRGYL